MDLNGKNRDHTFPLYIVVSQDTRVSWPSTKE